MAAPDPYEKHREAIRRTACKQTPFRLGHSVGYSGEDLPAPYRNAHSIVQFKRGVEDGRIAARIDRQRRLNGEALEGEALQHFNDHFGLGQGGAD